MKENTADSVADEDFGPLLDRLAGLGIVALPDGEWVETHGLIPSQMIGDSWRIFTIHPASDTGPVVDKVRIQTGSDGTARMLVPGYPAPVTLPFDPVLDFPYGRHNPYADHGASAHKALTAYTAAGKPPGSSGGAPSPVSKLSESAMRTSVDAMIERLARRPKKTGTDTDDSDYFTLPPALPLIFAAQLRQAGDIAGANRLAGAVFSGRPDRDRLVGGAISIIAGRLYREATVAFARSGDLAAYERELNRLSETFDDVWTDRSAVALLRGKIRAALAGKASSFVMPEGMPPDDDTLAALTVLGKVSALPTDSDSFCSVDRDTIWTLTPLSSFERIASFSGAPEPAAYPEIARLKKSGMAAIPTLVAALDDETPTPFVGALFYPGAVRRNPKETADERAHRRYGELWRPLTRGDIVRILLTDIFPETRSRDQKPPSNRELAERALAFWKTYGHLSRAHLACAYLISEDFQKSRTAGKFFIDSESAADAGVLEKFVSGSPDKEKLVPFLSEYFRAKGTRARSFAADLARRMKGEIPAPGRPESGGVRVDGVLRIPETQLKDFIAFLESSATEEPPREAILAVIRGPEDERENRLRSFNPLLDALPLARRISFTLEISGASDAIVVREWILSRLSRPYARGVISSERWTPPEPGSDEAKSWVALIRDPRFVRGGPGRGETYGEKAAKIFDTLVDPASASFLGYEQRRRDPELGALRSAQAEARLAGRPVPANPAPDTVSPERLRELLAGVLADPTEEQAVWSRTTLSERMAYFMTMNRNSGPYTTGEKDPVFAEAIRTGIGRFAGNSKFFDSGYFPLSEEDLALARRITAEFGLKVGDTLDGKRVTALCEALTRDAPKYSGTVLWFEQDATRTGLRLGARRVAIRPDPEEFRSREKRPETVESRCREMLYFSRPLYSAEPGDAIVCLSGMTRMDSFARSMPGPLAWKLAKGTVVPPETLGVDLIDIPFRGIVITVITREDQRILLGGTVQ